MAGGIKRAGGVGGFLSSSTCDKNKRSTCGYIMYLVLTSVLYLSPICSPMVIYFNDAVVHVKKAKVLFEISNSLGPSVDEIYSSGVQQRSSQLIYIITDSIFSSD